MYKINLNQFKIKQPIYNIYIVQRKYKNVEYGNIQNLIEIQRSLEIYKMQNNKEIYRNMFKYNSLSLYIYIYKNKKKIVIEHQ